jgi:hypothetical protein
MQLYYRELSFLRRFLCNSTRHNRNKYSYCCYYIVQSIGYDRARAKPNEAKKRGCFVTSATQGVIRPPSRRPFLIRNDERVRRDSRVEVGLLGDCKATVHSP